MQLNLKESAMFRHVRLSSNRLRIFSIILLVVGLSGATAVIARVYSINSTTKSATISQLASNSSTGKRRIEGELLVVRPSGFEPKQIKRPPGQPFLLAIDNQSGLPNLSLVLNSSIGPPVLKAALPREKKVWSEVLELPPGIYTLTESNHSDWVCTITVE
jgi:hypothetical protein